VAEKDLLKSAKECYADVKQTWRENHGRMLEDLRFSNPADPQQWPKEATDARKDRVCLTMDRTNQYIVQVVNGARMNKPSISVMPADSRADVDAATALDGVIRHIEYRSRAQIAYDWSIEGAARCGIGWLRPVPRVLDPETNEQEICIDRVADHLAAMVDGVQPDGADAMNGFIEEMIPRKRFKREYPDADPTSWDADGATNWTQGDDVRICEWQYVVEEESNRIVITGPDGGEITMTEEDYWNLSRRVGFAPDPVRNFMAKTRTVKWVKFSGGGLLEPAAVFPGKFIGLVPVIGFESFVDNKRQLCGMTRRLMDAQRAYNYERSAMVEAVALQPKAPVMVPFESVEGHEEHWESLNKGQPAYLPYNALDGEGRPFPQPSRLSPPQFPAAFAQGGQIAIADMEAAGGMYQANLGATNNATSGKQERERKQQGSVATFHFADNQARSIEHLGRIVVGMIPIIYDTKRQAKIMGVDGQQSAVEIDPDMQQAVEKKGKKVVAINPSVGSYDVRVKTGPSYTTQREEAAEGITAVLQAAPDFASVLAPTLVKLRDWPEAERVSRMLLAMAPAQVQAIANEGNEDDEEAEVPPQVQQQLQQMQEQGSQMAKMLDAAEAKLQRLQIENEKLTAMNQLKTVEIAARTESDEANEEINRYKAQTERWKVLGDLLAKGVRLPGVPALPGRDPTSVDAGIEAVDTTIDAGPPIGGDDPDALPAAPDQV
jgi:hypothetical protein